MDVDVALLALAAAVGFVFGLFGMAALIMASRADDIVDRWRGDD